MSLLIGICSKEMEIDNIFLIFRHVLCFFFSLSFSCTRVCHVFVPTVCMHPLFCT